MVRRDRSNRDYHAFIRCRYNVSPALICGFEPLRNSTQFPPLQVTDGTRGLQLEGNSSGTPRMPFTGRATATNTGIADALGRTGSKSANCCERVNSGDGFSQPAPLLLSENDQATRVRTGVSAVAPHRRSQPDDGIPKCLRRPPAAPRPACPRSAIEFKVDLTDQTEPCFRLYPSGVP